MRPLTPPLPVLITARLRADQAEGRRVKESSAGELILSHALQSAGT